MKRMPRENKTVSPSIRRKWVIALIFMLSAFVFSLYDTSTAEMYRWVDENGDTQITNTPPPQNLKSSEKVKVYRDRPEEAQSPDPTPVVKKNEPKPSLETKKNHEVILYGTNRCPYCRKAKAFFISRGIDFTDYDIEKDKEAALRKKELDPRGGVPFAIINGRSIRGFSESAYERALKE